MEWEDDLQWINIGAVTHPIRQPRGRDAQLAAQTRWQAFIIPVQLLHQLTQLHVVAEILRVHCHSQAPVCQAARVEELVRHVHFQHLVKAKPPAVVVQREVAHGISMPGCGKFDGFQF